MTPIRFSSRFAGPISMLAAALGGGFLVFLFLAAPTATQQSNFSGGTPRILELEGIQMLRLEFPAGSRSNWHSHVDGQLLMVESGRSRTQERGRPIREMGPGEPWYTPAGVEHWHGAAQDEAVVQWTIYGGQPTWLEAVGDDVYSAEIVR